MTLISYNLYVTQILFGSKPPFWNAGQLCCIDSVISIYLHVTDNICIVPQISKSRTWGNDGSGVNMLDMGVNVEEEYEIDSDNSFDFELGDDELQFNEKNYSIGNDYMNKINSKKLNLKADIYFLILQTTRFDRIKAKRIVKAIFGDK